MYFLNLLSDPYYDMDVYIHVLSLNKFSEMVACLFLFTPVHFSPSRTQYGGRERGRRIQGEAAWGVDPEGYSFSLLEILQKCYI